MSRFNGWGLMVLLCASVALAQDAPPVMDVPPATDAPPQAFSLSDKLLGEDNAMNNAGIEFFGWIQQGFTWNPDAPDNRFNGFTAFNDRSNEYQLNQLYAALERQVDRSADRFDIGGRLDLMVGTDARYIERAGVELHNDFTQNWNNEQFQYYHVAAPQFYLDALIPVGKGLLVRAGRFYTLHLPAESFMAPDNFFYSHTYAYSGGLASLDHVGLLLAYPINDQISVQLAYTTNPVAFSPGSYDGSGFVASLNWTGNEDRTTFDIAVSLDRFVILNDFGLSDSVTDGHYLVTTATLQHRFTEKLRAAATGIYGRIDDLESSLIVGNEELIEWFGASGALIYQISPTLSAGARLEWFRVDDRNGDFFADDLRRDYVAATAALNWKVHPNINIRPELRFDITDANRSFADEPFDDGTDGEQFTASIDVIITF